MMLKKYFFVQAGLMVALALMLEGSLRLDAAEGAIAGVEWLLAHPKHPPLPFWIIEFARQFGAYKYAVLHSLSFACIGFGIYFIFLTMKIIAPERAKAAALYLLCCPFLIYAPLQMNHNIALFPLWGACIYMLARAIYSNEWRWLGVAFGFALYAKYAIVMLAAPFAAMILVHKAWRKFLFSPWPYLAIVIALIIITPHLNALFELDNPFFHATKIDKVDFGKRLLDAGTWLMNAALLALPLLFGRGKYSPFALTAALGPFIFVLIAVLVFGVSSRPFWLLPMVLGFALLARDALKPRYAMGLSALVVCAYLGGRLFSPSPAYSDFDAKTTLKLVKTYENTVGKGEIFISLGAQRGRQLVGSLVFESEDPRSTLEEGDLKISPWVKDFKTATVISTRELPETVLGKPILKIEPHERPQISWPLMRSKKKQYFYIGQIRAFSP